MTSHDTTVRLTATESAVLRVLLLGEGEVLSPTGILAHVWESVELRDVGVVKTHIYHLRGKLSRLLGHQHHIQTVRGGYRFVAVDAPREHHLTRHAS